MSEWRAKRFWETASVEPEQDGFEVRLDSRALKTPAKRPLILPTRALAEAVAKEWDAQTGEINPNEMPLTRAVNSTVDKVVPQQEAVADMLAEYGATDLLCYRAEGPELLIAREAEAWDPLLDWAEQTYGARLRVTHGVLPVAQDPRALAALAKPLHAADLYRLMALHDLVTLPGSLVLGLAVAEGRVTADEGFAISRVDELWQQEQWGTDAEAEAAARGKNAQMRIAARLLSLCADA